VVLIAVVGWLTAGVLGIGVGVGCAIASIRSGSVVTVTAIAHAGAVVLFPESFSAPVFPALAMFELGVIIILASHPPVASINTVILVVITLGVAVGTLAAIYSVGLFQATVGLVVIGGLLLYGIHRYERVSLGLVSEISESG
jgi:hypothetical protein